MKYLSGVVTDKGIKKSTNQDSVLLRIGNTPNEDVALMILCDGMGGLSKGEFASACVVRAFMEWFDNVFPEILQNGGTIDQVKKIWEQIVINQNKRLLQYGRDNGVNLGTTITGILLINNEYLIVNVGDSRTYRVGNELEQITEDQSLIAREVRMGRLTPEQAITDPRKNVLLQCIGATADIEVEFYQGAARSGEAFLVCSDGFRHMISSEEILNELRPSMVANDYDIEMKLRKLVDLNKARMETDNITAGLIVVG